MLNPYTSLSLILIIQTRMTCTVPCFFSRTFTPVYKGHPATSMKDAEFFTYCILSNSFLFILVNKFTTKIQAYLLVSHVRTVYILLGCLFVFKYVSTVSPSYRMTCQRAVNIRNRIIHQHHFILTVMMSFMRPTVLDLTVQLTTDSAILVFFYCQGNFTKP